MLELVGGGEGKGGGVLSLHCNCQLANQPFMETRRLIALRCWGRAAMCDSPLFERRINSQPLIKNAHTPGGLGGGTTGVKA